MQRLIAVALLATMCTTVNGQSSKPSWEDRAGGQLILRPFASAPYPHPSREKGFKTFPKEPHYTDSTVGIFIPPGYQQASLVNYVVHFHGHKNHVSKVFDDFKLLEQFSAAKVNAILIVPQGPKDAGDSGCGKLEDAGGFGKLVTEVSRFLKAEKKIRSTTVGQIALSAHSGGYLVTSKILFHGGLGREITDVLLLDATYGELRPFANYCRLNRDVRLVSLYTDHLADENKELMGILTGMGQKPVEFDEKTLTDEQLAARAPIFIHTKGPHNQVPVDYFGRLVKTSALGK